MTAPFLHDIDRPIQTIQIPVSIQYLFICFRKKLQVKKNPLILPFLKESPVNVEPVDPSVTLVKDIKK